MQRKIEFLENCHDIHVINNSFRYLKANTDEQKIEKKQIDESIIKNWIKDAWKENEKLDSKLNTFKTNMTKGKEPLINTKQSELLSKALQKKDNLAEGGMYVILFF